jgi:hypothetical protein
MVDLIVRYCGHGEWLPIIRSVDGYGQGTELYRGDRQRSAEAAWNKAVGAWSSNATGNIIEFKRENPQADLDAGVWATRKQADLH